MSFHCFDAAVSKQIFVPEANRNNSDD